MSKGDDTRAAILDEGLDLASQVGLEGLSIGVLAKRVSMSKSGLYAHFDSKEALQCAVLDTAARRFVDVVIAPAIKEPRGVPRIRALFEAWLQWESDELTGGCLFVTAATEFDDREGPVRDRLVGHLRDALGAIARAAAIGAEEGQLREGLDPDQFAYEFWAILLAYQHFGRLLGDQGAARKAHVAFDALLDRSIAG